MSLRGTTIVVATTIAICGIRILSGARADNARPARLVLASFRPRQAPPAAPEPETLPQVNVEVSALDLDPAGADRMVDVLKTLNGPAATTAATATDPSDWSRRTHLDGSPVQVQTPPAAPLTVAADRFSDGASVVIVNRSNGKLPAELRLRLPRGVYTIERLITSGIGAPTGPDVNMAQIERIEGAALTRQGTVRKLLTLMPGQAVIYCATDQALVARHALIDLDSRLHDLGESSPGAVGRIRRVLAEGRPYLGCVASGWSSSDDRRLQALHHVLLILAQAQSLHHNFLSRGAVSEEHGAPVMDALSGLTEAVAETSATVLGLVPRIEVEPDVAAGPVPAEAGAEITSATVTLSLSNTGRRSVSLVKLGIDATDLPAGVVCEPQDPAIFGSLRPGQTVKAQFHVRGPGKPPFHYPGDVSYFATGAPAHLRPTSR